MDKFTIWLNKKSTLYKLMALAFVIRAGFGIAIGERYLPMADQVVFDELAKNIASGKGLMISERLTLPPEDMPEEFRARYYTIPERIRDLRMNALWGVVQPGKPTAFIEPLVPIIFAGIYKIFEPGLIAPRILQSFLDALVVGMLFSLGMLAFPRSRAPGIAALIYTFYPFSIMFTGALITQPIYLFLQCALIFLFYKFIAEGRWSYAILFGLVLGLTILTRISIITFAPFFIIAYIFQDFGRARWMPLVASIVLGGLLLVPWIVRNNNALGEPILLPTKGGRNLWEYNNQLFSREKLRGTAEDYEGVDIIYHRFAKNKINQIRGKQYIEFPEFTDESETERDAILNHNVQQFIRHNPGIFLQLCAMRFYQFFRITPSHHQHILFKIASILSFGWILPFSLIGMFLLLRHWRKLAIIYLLILYNIAVHTLTASGIPHRLPIDPFLILFASYTINRIFIYLKIINSN